MDPFPFPHQSAKDGLADAGKYVLLVWGFDHDQFLYLQHGIAISVNMSPYVLCFYMFSILLEVGKSGQIMKLFFFLLSFYFNFT